MTQHYNTTAAYISGGICGPIRWPHGAMAGRPLRKNLRGRWGILDRFTEPASFREALLRLLCEEGGEFQCPRFTGDTVIRVERRRVDAPGKYSVHVKELALDRLDCADLVDEKHHVGDFMAHHPHPRHSRRAGRLRAGTLMPPRPSKKPSQERD